MDARETWEYQFIIFLKKKKNKVILLSRNTPKFKGFNKNDFHQMDFTKEQDIFDAIKHVRKNFKFPDLVVNGAYTREKNITEMDLIKNLQKQQGFILNQQIFC